MPGHAPPTQWAVACCVHRALAAGLYDACQVLITAHSACRLQVTSDSLSRQYDAHGRPGALACLKALCNACHMHEMCDTSQTLNTKEIWQYAGNRGSNQTVTHTAIMHTTTYGHPSPGWPQSCESVHNREQKQVTHRLSLRERERAREVTVRVQRLQAQTHTTYTHTAMKPVGFSGGVSKGSHRLV